MDAVYVDMSYFAWNDDGIASALDSVTLYSGPPRTLAQAEQVIARTGRSEAFRDALRNYLNGMIQEDRLRVHVVVSLHGKRIEELGPGPTRLVHIDFQ